MPAPVERGEGREMSVTVEFRILELLSARLCHELVSPVGAINNGVELLGEDDPDFVRDAIELIGQSARKAGQRLQFYRFAYGTTVGASGAPTNGRELAQGLLEGGKVRCDWAAEAATLPVDWQRLACNMLVLAADILPRGGNALVRRCEGGIEVAVEGEAVNLSTETRAALDPATPVEQLSSRTVHAYFTARLASQIGATLTIAETDPARAVIRAAAG